MIMLICAMGNYAAPVQRVHARCREVRKSLHSKGGEPMPKMFISLLGLVVAVAIACDFLHKVNENGHDVQDHDR